MKRTIMVLAVTLLTAQITMAQYSQSSKKNQFITSNYVFALWVEKQTNVPISVTLGMGIQESGWGTSEAYTDKCNPLGMRKPNGDAMEFESLFHAYQYFIELMNNLPRYSDVKYSSHWRYSVIAIKDGGWNTEDTTWSGKIFRIILDNDLYKLDFKNL